MPALTAEKTTIHVRIDEETREQAQKNAKAVGIPLSTLIKAFLIQFAAEGVVPFPIKVPEPNKKVYHALCETEEGHGNHYKDSAEMFKKLGLKI